MLKSFGYIPSDQVQQLVCNAHMISNHFLMINTLRLTTSRVHVTGTSLRYTKWIECTTVCCHVADLSIEKLQTQVLQLHVFDYDRITRDDSIGEVLLPLWQVLLISGFKVDSTILIICKFQNKQSIQAQT